MSQTAYTRRNSAANGDRVGSAGSSHHRKQSAPTITERKTERTRETVTVRTRSPLKPTTDNHVSRKRSRDGNLRSDAIASKAKAEPSSQYCRTCASTPPYANIDTEPWSPRASLISHTTAPLASRVSIPPLAHSAPQSLQPKPLGQLSQEEQEKAILDDLMFVFMGFEGQYIRYVATYNPLEEKDRLLGPSFSILPGLDPSLRDLTASMLKLATHYIAVEAFLEVQSREEYGSVSHALCAAIRKLLKDYLILVAQLEHQNLTNPAFTLHVLNLHIRPTSHMLFQLYTLGLEVLRANGVLDDDDSDSVDDTEDFDNIIQRLQDNDQQGLSGKHVCKGGSVLGLITKRLASMSGDPAARELLTTLLRESSRPYMAMLNEWLHHGGIRDPHSEFLIREQKSIKREKLDQDYTDEYWDKRYTVRKDVIPPQLEAVKDKVLLAGKYLNVVRECGGVDISRTVTGVPETFSDPRFLENVNNAYAFANSSLMRLLLTTHALPARLRSLKHYFFLDRSDFFTYFLELSASELKKPAKVCNMGKLQSLLDIVLRQPGSVAAEDPYKEDVKVVMNEEHLVNWLIKIVNLQGMEQDAFDQARGKTGTVTNYLTPAPPPIVNDDKDIIGFDSLMLDYEMPFPLSLVVSRVTLTRYQILFRFLLSLRHLETLLVNSWTDHSKVTSWRHRSKDKKLEQWKRKAWTLRARMLVFVQQLLYYSTSEVIEPNWQSLMGRLTPEKQSKPGPGRHRDTWRQDNSNDAANDGDGEVKRTVDELMQDHTDFLASCLKECMLTNSKLLKVSSSIHTAGPVNCRC